MKTTEEMIAVMQSHADGEAIQRRILDGGIWTNVSSDSPAWDWGYFDYRKKPAEPKKVMMQMWRHPTFGDVSYPVGFEAYLCMQPVSEKIGEPYEFVYPEEEK